MLTYKIIIKGIVQGVGFRPFIHKLANKYNIKGKVLNKSGSVFIEAQGSKENIFKFFYAIDKEKPYPSIIEKKEINTIKTKIKYTDFFIAKSKKSKEIKLIPPDLRICDDCLKELFNQSDRRYKYPFINCTNCGPRFTIIINTPYDRKNTTMKKFKMCKDCFDEYKDINNRRYHAEPNACFKCGPEVFLKYKTGKIIKGNDAIEKAKYFLKKGKILAIKGLGGFHIAVDATNYESVKTLQKRKKRSKKPLAMMSDTLEKIKKYSYVDKYEEKLLKSKEGQIVLLKKKKNNVIADNVAEGMSHYGVFLPYTPLHYLLFDSYILALVMTSANISEEPIQYENDTAYKELYDIVDYFLFHNRDINIPADDSVIKPYKLDKKNKDFVIIRRSRGYVPVPIFLDKKYKDSIGVGALLKNTICFLKEDKAIFSQHIGDLENKKSYEYFTNTIERFIKFYNLNPEIIISDKHPDYLSTRFAEEFSKRKKIKHIKMQHHYAHFLSNLGENNFHKRAIGVIFDGTGLGDDNNIWGGEFFVGDFKSYKRVAHFKYIKYAGGDKVSKESFRCGISFLKNLISVCEIKKIYSDINIGNIITMLDKDINTFLSSSAGRIFDAVASILRIADFYTYDAEGPMKLEGLAFRNKRKINKIYDYKISKNKDLFEIDVTPGILQIIQEKKDFDKEYISAKFHKTMANIILDVVKIISKKYNIKDIALSGGVFQNTYLLTDTINLLKKNNFNVLIHKKLSPNDSSIGLGQVLYGSLKIRR